MNRNFIINVLPLLTGILWLSAGALYAQEVDRRFILIGDAGEINARQEILITAAAELVIPGKTATYFLGDNIYPTGMSLEDEGQMEYTGILQSQFVPFREKGAPVYFMAGNHDWDHSGPEGLAKVKAQEAFIHSLSDDELHFVPSAGSLGPFVEVLTDSIVTITYDSEYWLFPHHAPSVQAAIELEKQQFLWTLDRIAREHPDKKLLVMSHHPMRSYGEHSLHFSLVDHLFPLRKLWRKLYIPLPIIGSAYPLLRSTVLKSAEDLTHPAYQQLIESVTGALRFHPRVIYISGHDHGLQLIHDSNFTQIVSGSGAKTSRIQKRQDLLYKFEQQGFTVLDCLDSGDIIIRFYIVEKGAVNKDSEILLRQGKIIDEHPQTPLEQPDIN